MHKIQLMHSRFHSTISDIYQVYNTSLLEAFTTFSAPLLSFRN
ncbi:hypothetical protein [Elizabethkingia miricola]|nr:hypothetical protein [Elizabethkingia miricola]